MKKVSIIRHNLLGAEPQENDGILVNEVIYNEAGQEIERFHYDSDGQLEEHIITKVENGLNVEDILEIQGAISERTTRTFDIKGRVLSETRHYLEGGADVTSYEYEGDNLVLKHVIDTDGEEGEKETWEYENGKLMREVKYSLFGDIEAEKEYEYDENGLLTDITESVYREEKPDKTLTFYDELGRLTSEKKYDHKGRLVARTVVHYHTNGKPEVFEEENVRGKKTTTLTYDDSGNNITQEETDQNGNKISFVIRSYNESGNLESTEIMMEPSLYQAGQHYRLEYRYE
jgi:hypothetical protein